MVKLSQYFKGDKSIWAIYFFLCAISLVEVFSAASTLAYKEGNYWLPLIKQAAFLGAGTIFVITFHNVNVRFYRLLPLITVSLSFILLPFASMLGTEANGAQRWISVLGFQFQPSEMAKAAVVSASALILARTQRKDSADPNAFKFILWIALPIIALIFSENVSTAVLLFLVVIAMMFIGRIPMKQMIKIFLGVAAFSFVSVISLFSLPDNADAPVYKLPMMGRVATARARLMRHTSNPFPANPDSLDMDKNAQPAHAHIAIASCNVVGKMPGNSIERDFLSQAYSDFIFAIIIEELGLVGAAVVVALYLMLLFRVGKIAQRCERNYPAFLIMGFALLLVGQALSNMLVAVGILPVTGQPLPLISRGGTSTIVNSIYFGIILSVSRYTESLKKNKKSTRAHVVKSNASPVNQS